MIVSMWSFKAGQGLTTTAALTALAAARRSEATLLVDLDGDLPAVLGRAETEAAPGLAEWTRTTSPAGQLDDLTDELAPGLSLLPRGRGPMTPRADELIDWLNGLPGRVVVDAGTLPGGDREPNNGQIEMGILVTAAADRNWAVTRSCYLSLRRAGQAAVRPQGIVLVAEDGRVLTRSDVERAVGAPVVATVAVGPDISRAVDAGMIAARMPQDAAALDAAIGALPGPEARAPPDSAIAGAAS